MRRRSLEERFREKVEEDHNGCWIWCAARTSDGYGRIMVDRVVRMAHRVSHELFIGPIPRGLQIDHLCFNPPCVNPEHLEAVTERVNLQRKAARITHCPQGHEYDEENTYRSKRGRNCRECHRTRERERYHERKGVRT